MLAKKNERSVVMSLGILVPTYPLKPWFEPHFVAEYQTFSGYSHTKTAKAVA